MGKLERAFNVDEPRFTHSGGLERSRHMVHDGKTATIIEATSVREPDSLVRLYRRGVIAGGDERAGERRYKAANDWAKDAERAGMGAVVVASYSHGVVGDVEAEPERRRMAKERFRRGFAAMTGRGAQIVWGVVMDNRELKEWPWSAAYVSERFREALDELADFYGVPA